jgi:hypothetical protein
MFERRRAMTRPITLTKAFAFAFGLLLFLNAANAQQLCTVRDEAVAQLEGKFDEQVVGLGLVESGRAVVELFVSARAGPGPSSSQTPPGGVASSPAA